MNPTPTCVLATVESDSHTWNLVYLQLLLEEKGINVVNLGACTPLMHLIDSIRRIRPEFVVISSINGCGFTQGKALMARAKELLGDELPGFLIGGKLTTSASESGRVERELLAAGFDGAFAGEDAVERFCAWLSRYKATARYDLADESRNAPARSWLFDSGPRN